MLYTSLQARSSTLGVNGGLDGMCIRISANASFNRFQPFFPTLASNVLSATRNAPPGQVPPIHSTGPVYSNTAQDFSAMGAQSQNPWSCVPR